MRSFRDIRVIPVVLVAIAGLAVLKVAGLVIDGGYVFDYQPDSTKRSWAQEAFNFPTARAAPPQGVRGAGTLQSPARQGPPRRCHRVGSGEAEGGSRQAGRRRARSGEA